MSTIPTPSSIRGLRVTSGSWGSFSENGHLWLGGFGGTPGPWLRKPPCAVLHPMLLSDAGVYYDLLCLSVLRDVKGMSGLDFYQSFLNRCNLRCGMAIYPVFLCISAKFEVYEPIFMIFYDGPWGPNVFPWWTKNGPANGHCHKSPSPQGTEVTSWCTQIWGEEFMAQNPKKNRTNMARNWTNLAEIAGPWSSLSMSFSFSDLRRALGALSGCFLGDIQRSGLAKLSTSCSHKKNIFQNKGCSWMFQVDSSGWCQTQIPPAGLLGPFFMAKHHGGQSPWLIKLSKRVLLIQGWHLIFGQTYSNTSIQSFLKVNCRPSAASAVFSWLWCSQPSSFSGSGNGRSLYSCAAWPKMFNYSTCRGHQATC